MKNNEKKKNIKANTSVKKNKKNGFINIIGYFISLLLIIISAIFITNIFEINILKNIYVVFICIFIILFDLLFIKNLNNKKRSNLKRYISVICSIILIAIYLFINMYISNTVKFVKELTNEKSEYQTYSVVVKSDSKDSKLNDLKNDKIGFISSNLYLSRSENTLKNKIDYKVKEYSDSASAIDNLNNNKVNAIVFENNLLDVIEENNNEIYNSLKVIYTYKVKVPKKITKVEKSIKEPFIVYISGSDSRGTISDTARSDVNIVAVINPVNNKILLINIPRDYYVQLHGTTGTKDKLTHAGIYGVNMSKDTIADLLDTNIDYYVKVGFNTLITSVDLVGGIDITSDKAFTASANKKCSFIEGTQHVDGTCALAFSRERYAYTSGDRHRGENQQQVLTKMVEKFTTLSVLSEYNNILKSLNGSFQTNISYEEITSLIKDEATMFDKWSIESIALDGSGASESTYSMGSQKLYVMIPDENTVNNAKNKVKEYLK